MIRARLALLILSLTAGVSTALAADPGLTRLEQAINKNLGRPYALGSAGNKSYDCSGFVWRVLADAGVFIKRSSARKYYFAMPKVAGDADAQYAFGQLVFFDDLRHVGIVADQRSFFHAQTGQGTRRSPFDPYWRTKVVGFRTIPLSAPSEAPALATREP